MSSNLIGHYTGVHDFWSALHTWNCLHFFPIETFKSEIMLKAWDSTREKRNIHAGETGASIYTGALNTMKYM
jgi:hypothetical protein